MGFEAIRKAAFPNTCGYFEQKDFMVYCLIRKTRTSFPTNDVFLKDLFEGFESRSGQTQFFFPNDENF